MDNQRNFYVWNENLIEQCDRLPAVPGRASMVHNLITAYGILDHLKVVLSSQASYKELKEFHSELYLDHLKSFKDIHDEYMISTEDEHYGIGYDCPPVSNMFDLISTIAGGSITAAKCLLLDMADVVINWCGGWHHANRFGAEGFCYVNDIVLAIEKLRIKFSKVLYIDLDVHHGNGVQDAYNLSKSVFTLSFHKYEPGFYPGTGRINDIGSLSGNGYTCNFPLHASYSDETLEFAFEKVFSSVYSYFAPDAIVIQCGADALAHDPHGGARLTIQGYLACVRRVLDKRKPTILLGGGGYNHSNAARLWTSITALVAGVTLDESIPEHNYWPQYGPDYMLAIELTLAKDTNKRKYLDDCIATIIGNLEKYLGAINEEPELKRKNTDTVTRENSVTDNEKSEKLVGPTTSNRYINKKNVKQPNNERSNKTFVCEDVYTFTD